MRICVPLLSSDLNNTGSNDLPLAVHFGLAEHFAVVDSASGDILDECGIAGYCPGPCRCPLPNLANCDIEALAGQSVGFRLMQLSRRAKLPVLAIKSKTLGELRHEMRDTTQALPLVAAKCLTSSYQQSAVERQ